MTTKYVCPKCGHDEWSCWRTHTVYEEIKVKFPQFVRTGTHLFEFVDYVTMYRKWGRGLRTLIASWYTTKDADALAYQVVKYRQRGGWTHRDLLRKAHAKPTDIGKDDDL